MYKCNKPAIIYIGHSFKHTLRFAGVEKALTNRMMPIKGTFIGALLQNNTPMNG
jgi:hypothetical protein